MEVWLGRSYPHVPTITTLLLSLAYGVSNLTGVGTTVVAAVGKPRYESEYAVLAMMLNIGATLALAPFFGLYGVVIGTVIGVVLSSAYFLARFHRLMRLSAWEYLGTWLWRLAAATTLAAAPVLLVRLALPASVTEDRGKGVLALAGLGVLYLVLIARRVAALQVPGIARSRDGATRAPWPSAAAGLTAGRGLPLRGESMRVTRAPGSALAGDTGSGMPRWNEQSQGGRNRGGQLSGC